MQPLITHIFLDFDETLFDHYAYGDWLDEQLHNTGKLSGGRGSFQGSMDDFHDTIAMKPVRMRLYRHAEHIKATTGLGWDFMSAEIEKLATKQAKDFCYPDAHTMVEWLKASPYDVRILTFGDGDYQRYKISLSGNQDIRELPIHVVRETKRDFLTREYGQIAGVLIDDKQPLDLPATWTHIWINRDEPLDAPKQFAPHVIQISTLDQVPAAFELITTNL
jgi:FMN phosphatase YigB (HAD superfamily)